MKKKIMGVILAATLIVSQAVTAFAGSKTSEVGDYEEKSVNMIFYDKNGR